MRRLSAATAITAFAFSILAAPGHALAVQYTVNSTGDAPDKSVGAGGCETATASECTLRAAIQESNASVGTKDSIVFFPGFEGQGVADTITLGASFPAVKDPVTIEGGTCTTEAGFGGPCVGVNGPSGGFGLKVESADEVTIAGLAVTGALVGIDVIDSSQSFTAVRNWLGVRLDGVAAANNTGLFLDPNSDSAVIGVEEEGNVLANNNNEGLDLDGASSTTIQGNLFGVEPDGVTQAANGKDIEITGSTAAPGFKATGNVVGDQLTQGEAGTPECDGACNVISGASIGIDIKGNGAIQEEEPAGETMIWGNHIGLNAAGTGAVGNTTGILVGEADEIKIGGPSAQFANHINGGTAGIQAGPAAQDLLVERNLIGLNHPGTAMLSPPTNEGIYLKAEGSLLNHNARIAKNVISMGSGIAIEVEKGGPTATEIFDNAVGRGTGGESLTGAAFGIRVDGPPGTGNLIERNVIENSHLGGLLIESSNNEVTGNEITGTESGSGIAIQNFLGVQEASGNTIGGNTPADENEISGSSVDAIEIVNGIDTDNHVLRNTGSGNGGLFIDLGGDGLGNQPTGPNDGIQAPSIAAATPTAVSGGGALSEAVVRVFEKATPQNGEIEGFLGEAEADGSGNWSLTYAVPLPVGTEIGATQTGFEGTSELAQATTTTPPPPPGGGGAGGPSADTTAPQTKITKAPKGKSSSSAARFKFASTEAGSTFQCKLDRKPFKSCRSPKKYKGLRPGNHVFKVRATDGAGNTDPTPAVKKFTVLK